MDQSSDKVHDFDRGNRLRAERKRLSFTIESFAKLCGVSKGSQINYEKGFPPTADYLAASLRAGVDVLFILGGEKGQNFEPLVRVSRELADVGTYQLMRLPIFDIEAAAGHGQAVQEEVRLGEVAFDRQFLRDRGASPDQCTVIRAKGDSMSPTIPDGSLLIVDHSQRDVSHGYITVIGIGNDLLVKRVRRRLDGTVELISDNNAYPPEVIGTDRLDQLRVVGRVVYFCRVP